jgi:hypothetical protein
MWFPSPRPMGLLPDFFLHLFLIFSALYQRRKTFLPFPTTLLHFEAIRMSINAILCLVVFISDHSNKCVIIGYPQAYPSSPAWKQSSFLGVCHWNLLHKVSAWHQSSYSTPPWSSLQALSNTQRAQQAFVVCLIPLFKER